MSSSHFGSLKHFHSNPRVIDDDAASDWTLDLDQQKFGAPLERMREAVEVDVQSYEDEDDEEDFSFSDDDDDNESIYYQEDQTALLRRLEEQLWLEDQDEVAYLSDQTPPSSDDDCTWSTQMSSWAGQQQKSTSSSTVPLQRLDLSSQDEIELAQYLNSRASRDDPWNLAVPTLRLVESDDEAYLLNLRLLPFNASPFKNANDSVDFVRQLLQGLVFFHENKITGMDFIPENIGMDTGLAPLDDDKSRPFDRAEYPVRYYVTDITGAKRDSRHPCELGPKDDQTRAYADDIFMLGSMLQTLFKETQELDFIRPLLSAMTSPYASKRPSAPNALAQLDSLAKSASFEQLFKPLSA